MQTIMLKLVVFVGLLEFGNCATTTLPTAQPDTFDYTCNDNGDIHIPKSSFPANTKISHLDASSHCKNQSDTGIEFVFTECDKDVKIKIAADTEQDSKIVGGKTHKEYNVKCDNTTVDYNPYIINATVNPIGISVKTSVIAVGMITPTAPTHPTSLNMLITTDPNSHATQATSAVLGQSLTLWIEQPVGFTVKPVSCLATGNGLTHSLWNESHCEHDDELIGKEWENATDYIKDSMYAFRFQGQSTQVSISCQIRVCPHGYTGNECDLKCTTRRRKRNAEDSEELLISKAETSLNVLNGDIKTSDAHAITPISVLMGMLLGLLTIVTWQ